MQKFRFSGLIVVEVSTSPLDRPEKGNRYTIYNCLCRPYGHKKGTRAKYQVTATSAANAARLAVEFYHRDTNN